MDDISLGGLALRSCFSPGHPSRPSTLVQRAAELGYGYVALCDWHSVAGAVELHQVAQAKGMKALLGARLELKGYGGIQLLCQSRSGYTALNQALSLALSRPTPQLSLDELLGVAHDWVWLSGGRGDGLSQLLAARRWSELKDWLSRLQQAAPLWISLYHDLYPGDNRRLRSLRALAGELRLGVVAALEVNYARKEQFPLYDALQCARLGIEVETPHPSRPQSDAQYLLQRSEALERIPFPEAWANAWTLATECAWGLLPKRLSPPPAQIPAGLTAQQHLEARAYGALARRYIPPQRSIAEERLKHELGVVEQLELANFFLVAAEITDYCRSRGILAAGRGSAAGSVLCYLLGISQAEPLKNDLLFERFLHTGRQIMPDIDIDIASSRRDEVLAWVEKRFGVLEVSTVDASGEAMVGSSGKNMVGPSGEAMVANRITYRLPSAIQDLGRALGLPPAQRNLLSKRLGREYRHLQPVLATDASAVFDEVLGPAPLKGALLRLLGLMERGTVRHLAPHSGGVVLSGKPLYYYSPLFTSSGGIRCLTFDKDDIEALGLIKLDLLGLRMLAALERARNEVFRLEGHYLDLTALPDDPAVWQELSQGDTLALFQIESPAQQQSIVRTRPRNLQELAHQVALIRPGPIQSGSVHPYVRRRMGLEPISYAHPALQPILEATYGVLLYQEQVLRILVHLAGMDWAAADRARKRLGPQAEPELHQAFVQGMQQTVGASLAQAQEVWGMVCSFQGYGFAESHAQAFALHAYASAYMRRHYPAAYLAAFMAEAPGMWPAESVKHEALKRGVGLLPPHLQHSHLMPRAVRQGGQSFIRLGLAQVEGLGLAAAQRILQERMQAPFQSLKDAVGRLELSREQFETLARVGALGPRRAALYQVGVLCQQIRPGSKPLLWPPDPPLPPLDPITFGESLAWDLQLQGMSALPCHPLDLFRAELKEHGYTPMAHVAAGTVRTAGWVVSRQRPPTAAGFAFWVIEDHALRVQVVIPPQLWQAHSRLLQQVRVLGVEGVLSIQGHSRTLRARGLEQLG